MRATIVFIDESGMLMAPLVRRSWSVRGHTPVLRQRGAHYQKVSAVAAVCIPPTRDRIALYFRLHPDANINTERSMSFLEHLQRQLRTPIVLIWDRFQAHKGELIRQCVVPRSAHLEYLPPYAPELNPVEYLWAY
ncbi:MAG: transposase, partial [Steroidobacteraceae bacterium]